MFLCDKPSPFPWQFLAPFPLYQTWTLDDFSGFGYSCLVQKFWALRLMLPGEPVG
jgi:hypothetical protein